jgi:hypothetical protein
MRENTINVPLPAELRAFVESRAAQEDRSLAGVVRRIIAKEARRCGCTEQQEPAA